MNNAINQLGRKGLHIREFQNMIRRIYFHCDSRRGEIGIYKWLMNEVKELGEAMRKNNKKALEDEFADVFAWLASLANVVNVNLEKAATAKYDGKCPKCQKTPCKCTFLVT